jgi:hypothetical protein
MVIGYGPPTAELEWFCLGCRGEVLGRVYYVAPFLPSADEDFRLVAPSFAAFLAILADHDPGWVQAVKAGDVTALRRWLAAGGDPNQLYQGMCPLTHAVIHARPDSVRELLAAGAKVHRGLLSEARHAGSQEVIELLWSHGKASAPKEDA